MYQTSSKLILIIALSTLNAQITKESFIGEWNVDKESYLIHLEKLLYLLRTYKRYGFGQGSQTSIPSRFLSDISDLSIQSLEKNNSHSRNDITNLKSNINTSEECIQLLDPIEIGTKVIHKTFGEGIVLLCTESGNDFVVDVHFSSAGKKKLLMSLANLQMIKKTK